VVTEIAPVPGLFVFVQAEEAHQTIEHPRHFSLLACARIGQTFGLRRAAAGQRNPLIGSKACEMPTTDLAGDPFRK
jgi:hypothetical protein